MLERLLSPALLDELTERYPRDTALSYLNGLSMLSNTMANIGKRVDILNRSEEDGLEPDSTILKSLTPLNKENSYCEKIINEYLKQVEEVVSAASPALLESLKEAGWLSVKEGALRFLTKKGFMGYLPESGPDVFRPKPRPLGTLRNQAIVSLSCLEELFTRRQGSHTPWNHLEERTPAWLNSGLCAKTDFSYNLVSSTGSLFYRPSAAPSAYNRLKAHAMFAVLLEKELGDEVVTGLKSELFKDVIAWKSALSAGLNDDDLPRRLYSSCDVTSCKRIFKKLETKVVKVLDRILLTGELNDLPLSKELANSFGKVLCSHNTFVRLQHAKPDFTTYEWILTYAGDMTNIGTSIEYGKERSVKACNAFSNMILLPSFLRMKEWLYEDELQGKASGGVSLNIIAKRSNSSDESGGGTDFTGVFSSDFSRYDDTVTLTLSCFTLANLIISDIISTDAQLYAYLASFSGTILFSPNTKGHLHAADSVFYFDKQGGTASGFKLTSHVGSFMNWELQKFSAVELGFLKFEDIARTEVVGHQHKLRMISPNWCSTFSADDNISWASHKILNKLNAITESMERKGMAVKPAYDPQYLSIMYMTPPIAEDFVKNRLKIELPRGSFSSDCFSPNVVRRLMQACRPENPHELYSYSLLSAFDTILSLQMGIGLDVDVAALLFVKYIAVTSICEVPNVTTTYDGGVRLNRMMSILEDEAIPQSFNAIQYLSALARLRASIDRGSNFRELDYRSNALMNLYRHQSVLQRSRLDDKFIIPNNFDPTDYLAMIVNADLTAAMTYNPEQNSETIRSISRVMGGEEAFGTIERALVTISDSETITDKNGLTIAYRRWLSRRVKSAKNLCKWRSTEEIVEDISDHLDDLLLEGKHSKWNRAMAGLLDEGHTESFMTLLHRYFIS